MRGDRMERFVLLPFAVGCMSESSVAVTSSPQSQYRPSLHPPPTIITNDDDECSSKSSSSWSLPKPNLSSIGIDRLFKTFSHLFVYKEEEDEEEEIEIGEPTDVKHVTHIGWDGVVVNNIRGAEGGHNTNMNQQDRTLQLDHHFFLNSTNHNERLQLRLSKTSFNDHHQLPHPNPNSAAASVPQTDGQQDHTLQTTPINPDHHHFMIAHHPSSSLQTNLEEEEEEEHYSVRTM